MDDEDDGLGGKPIGIDQLIANCGLATYVFNRYYYMHVDTWRALLRGAKTRGYAYRYILKEFHNICTSLRSESHFNAMQNYVRKQHRRVYKWFRSCQPHSYISAIPNDLRWMILQYLRTTADSSTYIMSIPHSFDDEPAIVQPGRWVWYNEGRIHRSNGPAIIDRFYPHKQLRASFMQDGVPGHPDDPELLGYFCDYRIHRHYYVVRSSVEDRTNDPDIAAMLQELWDKYE